MFCSKKETDEATKIKNQDEVKRFYLFSFHVYHLRDLLKCCICLELYNCPIELCNCKHVFCKDCIESYMEYSDTKETKCPICQTLIGNDSTDQHKFFETITNFVKFALEDVNVILGSNLNKLPSYSKICESWEQNKDASKIFTNIRASTLLSRLVPDYTAILKAKKVVIEANAKYVSDNKEGNSAFDALAQAPAVNRFFKQNRIVECNKTYTNKKQESVNCYVDKLQKFENDVNKKDILHWLEDSRNKFDAVPLTQQQIMEEIPDFDLPSISQGYFHQKRLRNRPQIPKANVTASRQSNFVKDKCSTKERRRTRSLECHKQVVLQKPKLKRHSLATCHVDEEVVIEQVSSEEDAIGTISKKAVIVNLMEEKYLDAIDKKLLSENKQGLSDSTKVSRRSSLRNSKHETSTDSSRGWNRIKEIKKTIENTKKKSGKLKVISGNSSTNILNEDAAKSKTSKKTRKSKQLSTTIFESAEECNTKSCNLNDVEMCLSDNLNKVTAPEPPQLHCSKVNVKGCENQIEVNVEVHSVLVEKNINAIPNNTKVEKIKTNFISVLQNKKHGPIQLNKAANIQDDENEEVHSVIVETNTSAISNNINKLNATKVKKTKFDLNAVLGNNKLKYSPIRTVDESLKPHCSNATNFQDDENEDVHSVLVETKSTSIPNNNIKPSAIKAEKTKIDLNPVLQIKKLKYSSNDKAKEPPKDLQDDEIEENEKDHLVLVGKETSTIPSDNIQRSLNKVETTENDLNSALQNKKLKKCSIHESKDEVIEAVTTVEDPVSENIIATSQINENVQMPKLKEVFKNMLMIHGMENGAETCKLQKEKNIINYDDSDEVFEQATQEISTPITPDRKKTVLRLPSCYTERLLLIQNILDNDEDSEETLDKLRKFFVDDAKQVTFNKTLKPVAVQTDDIKGESVLFSNVPTQTTLSHHKNVGVQTDSYEPLSGFRISSTDMFHIQPVINSSTQTDCLSCPNCQFVIFKSDQNISQKRSQTTTTRTFKNLSLSGSFDNINFETQDVIKGQEISFKGLGSKSFTRCKSTDADNKTLQVVSPTPNQGKIISCVGVSGSHKDVTTSDNKTQQVFKETKNVKRIRTASLDSDPENEHLQVIKKNKYVNDISVDFLTEPEGDVLRGQSEKLESLHSDNVDFGKVLDNVLKKCDEDKSGLSRDNVRIEPVPKRLKTQDIIRECEQIIKEACSTTLRIEHTQFAQEAPKPLTLLEEFNQNFKNIDDLNVEPQNESVHTTKTATKFSESLFTSAENLKSFENRSVHNDENLSNHNISKQKVDDLINQFKDIEDSFEEDYNAEVESITESMLESSEHSQRIKILQNIVLNNNNNNEHTEEVNDHVNGNKSPEMFDSDQEIIETTPQKNRPSNLESVSLLSQVSYKPKARMMLPLEEEVIGAVLLDPLSCFNKTFTPPPEFQDFIENIDVVNENNDKEEKENAPQLSSLTADLLENEFINKRDHSNFITSTPLPSSSQVLSSKTLNLSPIHPSTKQMNPILAVQNAAKLPLTITPSRQRMTPLTTSTPKQKSILNYVKSGDNLNTSSDKTSLSQFSQSSVVSLVQRIPNVACTRMNKSELSTIISLSRKNMIMFMSSFSSMVTHMIVAVDKRNHLLDHTMKFVCAVAAGIWVVNIKWIEECLKQNKIVSEEPYEALDVSGVDGPRQSRLKRCQKPLLNNYVMYAAPPFSSTTQKEVEKLIILLGGEVVQRPDDLLHNNGKIRLIITESTGSHPDDVYDTWLETLKVATVDLEWLSRSVGKFEIQSLRPFVLCCDASIDELAYPSLLLEDVPYSSTHNTLT